MTIPRIKIVSAVVAVFGLLAAGCAEDGARTDEGAMQQVEIVDEEPVASMPDAGDDSPSSAEATDDEEATVEGTSVVEVTVVGVTGYAGGDLAGVVMRESDGLVVGGFATKIAGDPFTMSQPVLLPAEPDDLSGPWPHVTDERAGVPPGEYVLSLWVDTGLGGYTRWFPMNSDGRGLAGCVQRFSVGDEAVTKVVVGGDVRWTGYLGVCESGGIIVNDSGFPPAPVEVVVPDRTRVTPPFAGEFDEGRFGMVQELLVWQDEFLAIGRIDAPQPLPSELPTEIAEQFPPEIQDLFPDGLPPTIDEAMAVIEEADMMSEVMDAVSSIPGADEAIFGLGPMPPSWLFARSVDGAVWEQFDVNLPDEIEEIFDVAASGDRLVVAGHRPPADASFESSEVVVAWSDDLVSWTTARLGPERPDDLPEGATLQIWHASAHANDLGWMVDAFVGLDLGDADLPGAPSPELARYLEDGAWGPPPVSTLWFSSWGGEPAITMPVASEVSTAVGSFVVATHTGFVHMSDAVRYTDDGMTWETRSVLAANGMGDLWSAAVQSIPDGFVVIFGGSSAPPTVYRVDDGGEQWIQLEVAGLPSDLWQVMGGHGYLFDSSDWDENLEQWIVATPDGEQWYFEQYNSFDPAVADEYESRVAALHDDTLLVGGAFVDEDWWALAF